MTLRSSLAVFLVLAFGAGVAVAQTAVPEVAPSARAPLKNYQPERDRIAAERRAVEARFQQEEAACYQRFAVDNCLRDSRARRRAQTDDLKRQEAAINDIERKRRGAEQLKRLDEKQATPRTQDRPEQQEQARQAQRDREQAEWNAAHGDQAGPQTP